MKYNMFALSVLAFMISCVVQPCQGQGYKVKRESLGKVKESKLSELSGLLRSQMHKGMFWCHNDSGDSSQFFLIDQKAKLRGTYVLEGIHTRDTEDIASFRKNEKAFLILADIGDNRAVRDEIVLYVFQEPGWDATKTEYLIPRDAIRVVRLRYADKPRDAEAIFVDPLDNRCYIISKRDFNVGVYPIDLTQDESDNVQVIAPMASLPLTFITSADISADGTMILMKNVTNVFLWQRGDNEPITSVFSKPFTRLPYEVEPQGEAICFGIENSIFYTISERPLGLDSYLYRYDIRPVK